MYSRETTDFTPSTHGPNRTHKTCKGWCNDSKYSIPYSYSHYSSPARAEVFMQITNTSSQWFFLRPCSPHHFGSIMFFLRPYSPHHFGSIIYGHRDGNTPSIWTPLWEYIQQGTAREYTLLCASNLPTLSLSFPWHIFLEHRRREYTLLDSMILSLVHFTHLPHWLGI